VTPRLSSLKRRAHFPAQAVYFASERESVLGHSDSDHSGEEAPPMNQILETELPREHYDVFEVTQITRGTPSKA